MNHSYLKIVNYGLVTTNYRSIICIIIQKTIKKLYKLTLLPRAYHFKKSSTWFSCYAQT